MRKSISVIIRWIISEGLEVVLLECLSELSEDERSQVKGIAVDTTGSTPAPVNEQGEITLFYPICGKSEWDVCLWKNHTGVKERQRD